MELTQLQDKRNVFLLLGAYCNDLNLLRSENYKTTPTDYYEEFHKTVFGAINNISKKGNFLKTTPLEIENELAQFKSAYQVWKNNDGYDYIENAIEETENTTHNIDLYFDNVRKYSILRVAVNKLKMDISFLYNENDTEKMNEFSIMKSTDVLGSINGKFNEFKNMWNNSFEDAYSFHAGDDIEDRIKMHKEQDNSFGYPFQSGYMTTVFRGMRPKKFMVRSSVSGGGKTRNSLAEACNIASEKIYNWKKREWLFTGNKQAVLFISTELEIDEIQDCLLAHISGIDEDRIAEWRDITAEEELILIESGRLVKESLLFGEYVPDFTIDTIEELILKYIVNEKINFCFFDYINDSPALYSYYIEKTKVKLQTHQILFMFSMALKRLANKYNIYLGSATQVSSNHKDEKDANAIKGSKAIIDKADYGVLALPATSADLKKLKLILENGFYEEPNMGYYIFKNRGGRWKSIIVWTRLNLGTVREIDCFVTTSDFELVSDIEKTIINFQIEEVGDCETFQSEETANEYISQFINAKLDE
jgi:replicative DNA helicase